MISDESLLPRVAALQILSMQLFSLTNIGIFLVNGYPLYDKERDTDINEFKFWNTLVGSLSFHTKEVYTSASEVAS